MSSHKPESTNPDHRPRTPQPTPDNIGGHVSVCRFKQCHFTQATRPSPTSDGCIPSAHPKTCDTGQSETLGNTHDLTNPEEPHSQPHVTPETCDITGQSETSGDMSDRNRITPAQGVAEPRSPKHHGPTPVTPDAYEKCVESETFADRQDRNPDEPRPGMTSHPPRPIPCPPSLAPISWQTDAGNEHLGSLGRRFGSGGYRFAASVAAWVPRALCTKHTCRTGH